MAIINNHEKETNFVAFDKPKPAGGPSETRLTPGTYDFGDKPEQVVVTRGRRPTGRPTRPTQLAPGADRGAPGAAAARTATPVVPGNVSGRTKPFEYVPGMKFQHLNGSSTLTIKDPNVKPGDRIQIINRGGGKFEVRHLQARTQTGWANVGHPKYGRLVDPKAVGMNYDPKSFPGLSSRTVMFEAGKGPKKVDFTINRSQLSRTESGGLAGDGFVRVVIWDPVKQQGKVVRYGLSFESVGGKPPPQNYQVKLNLGSDGSMIMGGDKIAGYAKVPGGIMKVNVTDVTEERKLP